MDTNPANPRVLVLGLDPYRVPGDWDPEPVARRIDAGLSRFAAHGVGMQACLIGLDGSDDITAMITEALRSRPWECVVVGSGLRVGDGDAQVELFEEVINLIRRYADQAAIAFNSRPDDTYDAAARWLTSAARDPR